MISLRCGCRGQAFGLNLSPQPGRGFSPHGLGNAAPSLTRWDCRWLLAGAAVLARVDRLQTRHLVVRVPQAGVLFSFFLFFTRNCVESPPISLAFLFHSWSRLENLTRLFHPWSRSRIFPVGSSSIRSSLPLVISTTNNQALYLINSQLD